MNKITNEQLDALIKSAVNSSGPFPPDEKFSQIIFALRELRDLRAAMLQGADGALTNEDAKQVGELVMWVKRLAHSLRKANPDSKLQSDAMDYLSRKGLIGVEDILR
ncbi:hypothetical protein P3S37_24300 [Enterobacter hormaechei]|uniref:hypothetical protein n=1 Tax=Enterobacter hormaechei TaxID=158836 RepID=UPI00079C8CFA|nr:hypothetical protein [Enterobacter hormaechei]MCL8104600.1 hypothetical protein [Enterobacter hormaechei]MCM8294740.1 hypothetical protein [Enterobacter hormaechei]MCM8309309.1 hypothetical protein [Enterobacter hormaechei]MCM8370280.1 hypothetical protein [Enterobacter hormaechei]MCM8375200.1 hypothetical protein [Enterobacter hormaechei]